jgi:hypothetical protein
MAVWSFLREGFIVKLAGGEGVGAEVELVVPSELEAGFAEGLVTLAG